MALAGSFVGAESWATTITVVFAGIRNTTEDMDEDANVEAEACLHTRADDHGFPAVLAGSRVVSAPYVGDLVLVIPARDVNYTIDIR